MKLNPIQERIAKRADAAKHFVRAAAMLGEMPTRETTGEALFWAALGLLRLAQSDPDESNLDYAEVIIRSQVAP